MELPEINELKELGIEDNYYSEVYATNNNHVTIMDENNSDDNNTIIGKNVYCMSFVTFSVKTVYYIA